jgi:hypothetical protein
MYPHIHNLALEICNGTFRFATTTWFLVSACVGEASFWDYDVILSRSTSKVPNWENKGETPTSSTNVPHCHGSQATTLQYPRLHLGEIHITLGKCNSNTFEWSVDFLRILSQSRSCLT